MPDPSAKTVAILGTNGVPARYGGFETLAEHLVRQAASRGLADRITVWRPAAAEDAPAPETWMGARIRTLPLRANGVQSIPYDMASLAAEAWSRRGADAVLLLGTSGAAALRLFRMTSRTRIVVNVDGCEWQRAKWGPAAKAFLRWSERCAVRSAHEVVADNSVIADAILDRHRRTPTIIAYGGDHAVQSPPADISDLALPAAYALASARAEPENHLGTILEAFAPYPDRPLVVLSNWQDTAHGRALRATYRGAPNLYLLDAEHDPARLRAIRDRAVLYLHGHSVGGTNPCLVEMMYFAIPIAVFDCGYNQATTEGVAATFSTHQELSELVPSLLEPQIAAPMGASLAAIARRRYRWDEIATAYFDLLGL